MTKASAPASSPITGVMPASAIAVPVDDEDLEETMISASRSGVAPKVVFTLQFSTGQELTVVGHSLLGRNPKTNQGESVENLLVVIDPARSVSKTHLEVNIIDGKLWITDRHSGMAHGFACTTRLRQS